MQGVVRELYRQIEQGQLSKEEAVNKMEEISRLVGESRTSQGPQVGYISKQLISRLEQLLADFIRVSPDDIDADTPLKDYGFDSLGYMTFTTTINQAFDLNLIPAIFFDHATLKELADHLVEHHYAVLAQRFRVKEPEPIRVNRAFAGNPGQEARKGSVAFTPQPASRKEHGGMEPIAIVGMSGKFPLAEDLEQFWDNLKEGRDCITEMPADRWDLLKFNGDLFKAEGKTNIKWGGYLEGIDQFDPMFFEISPREAEVMDPQQRILMAYVWKTIEDAGYSPQSLSGTDTAIFVGTAGSGYSEMLVENKVPVKSFTATGMSPSIGPNRMSYLLNLYGPSEPVETACSSSLVAIHRAVKAIESGDCEMAIAGGVNLILNPHLHMSFNKAGMLAPDGRCKTFSSAANGYVRGEGVGMIFLKKLSDAERSGDHIYGVIRGTSENHGGRSNSLTAPNPKAQVKLLVKAYQNAGVDPNTVTYIEAHGTGTALGDPIEFESLRNAFQQLAGGSGNNGRCGIGSVKTNIGHLELSAGIAGVIKVLLQMKHRTLVKSLHCEGAINPYIKIEDSPFYIVQQTEEWNPAVDADGNALPLRAGVSSFGFGGVNAHIVLEEYMPPKMNSPKTNNTGQEPMAILISAKNEERLNEQVRQLLTFMKAKKLNDGDMESIAYTLQVGRDEMQERLACVVDSIEELQNKLKDYLEGIEKPPYLYRGQARKGHETVSLFNEDEELQDTASRWLIKRKYTKILNLWVNGLKVDWSLLYKNTKPRRMSLPTYPFARESYWIPKTKSSDSEHASKSSASVHSSGDGKSAAVLAATGRIPS